MTMGMLFWLLMILWLVFGLWWHWPAGRSPGPAVYWPLGGNLLLFLLLFLLGWRVFDFVVQG